MTNQEALHKLEFARVLYAWNAEDLEAVNLAIAALEKQIPMEPEKIDCDEGLTIRYFCPKCKCCFGQRGKHSVILFDKEIFCQNPRCGQMINWEEEDEDSD